MRSVIRNVVVLIGGLGQEINTTCPTITPTVGPTEILADPGLEGTYTGGLCAALSKTGTPNVAQSADVHGGEKAQQFTAVANLNALYISVPTTVGEWYQYTAWAKRTAGTAGSTFFTAWGSVIIATATYTQYINIDRAAVTTSYIYAAYQGAAAPFDTVVVDDMSLKKLDFTSTLAYLGKRRSRVGRLTCNPTIAQYTQAGLVLSYVDANNLVVMYVNRIDGKAYLDKRVNGTWANVIKGAVTYIAGKPLTCVVGADNSYTLSYNDIAVGSPTAINDAAGTRVYGFSTFAGNSVGNTVTSLGPGPG